MAVKTKEQRAFLAEAASLWPMAKGCLALVRRPCIRPKCSACERGEKHPAWIFTFRVKGRQRCLYVRPALVGTLRQAIRNARRMEELLTRSGAALIARHRLKRPERDSRP